MKCVGRHAGKDFLDLELKKFFFDGSLLNDGYVGLIIIMIRCLTVSALKLVRNYISGPASLVI